MSVMPGATAAACTVTTSSSGTKLTTPTYVVKLSSLKQVNKTPVKALGPDLTKEEAAPDLFTATIEELLDEEKYTETYSEMDDNHYTQMTIRDLYCMLQNVPLSNKKWLNQLITKGKEWQTK